MANVGGVRSLIPTGNTHPDYLPPGPPGMDNRVFTGFADTLASPSTRLPRMPLLDKITPRGVPATSIVRQRAAQGRVLAFNTVRRARNTATAYVNAAKTRRR